MAEKETKPPQPAHLEEKGIDVATTLDVVQTGAAVASAWAAAKVAKQSSTPPPPPPTPDK